MTSQGRRDTKNLRSQRAELPKEGDSFPWLTAKRVPDARWDPEGSGELDGWVLGTVSLTVTGRKCEPSVLYQFIHRKERWVQYFLVQFN